jgi:hypothetical protein
MRAVSLSEAVEEAAEVRGALKQFTKKSATRKREDAEAVLARRGCM